MFSLAVDETYQVLLITVSGELSADDFANADVLLRPLIKTAQSLDTVIIDLRSMSGFDMSMEQLIDRARAGPALRGRRHAFVVSDPYFSDISRLFAEHRERAGHGATTIVHSLEEAYRVFDINPVFR
ncbi:MAG TPA: hypothetical protein VLA02_15130 [Reyranella sp.]|nr:hypothetical protein [Reyranella sp.]